MKLSVIHLPVSATDAVLLHMQSGYLLAPLKVAARLFLLQTCNLSEFVKFNHGDKWNYSPLIGKFGVPGTFIQAPNQLLCKQHAFLGQDLRNSLLVTHSTLRNADYASVLKVV